MKYFIVTGTTRGLGEAIVLELLDRQHCLFCISRQENPILLEEARNKQCTLYYITCDLNDIHRLSQVMEEIFQKIDRTDCQGLYLVNNAGVVDPIKPVERCDDTDMISNIHVNLMAPMLLTSAFVRLGSDYSGKKRVLNISSGAGKNPYYGWSSYCSAKAGLDLFTRCASLEAQEQNTGVEYMAFAPGIVDTGMQARIRETEAKDFIQVERFIDFKESGVLLAPEMVAGLVAQLLLHKEWGENPVVDIRECFAKSE